LSNKKERQMRRIRLRKFTAKGIEACLGTRLRKWRKLNKLKGYQLADHIGLSQASLSDIENNHTHPSANTVALLIKKTNINPIWLLLNEGDMER